MQTVRRKVETENGTETVSVLWWHGRYKAICWKIF